MVQCPASRVGVASGRGYQPVPIFFSTTQRDRASLLVIASLHDGSGGVCCFLQPGETGPKKVAPATQTSDSPLDIARSPRLGVGQCAVRASEADLLLRAHLLRALRASAPVGHVARGLGLRFLGSL